MENNFNNSKTIKCSVCNKELTLDPSITDQTKFICDNCVNQIQQDNSIGLPDYLQLNAVNYNVIPKFVMLLIIFYLISSVPQFTEINTLAIYLAGLIPDRVLHGEIWRLITANLLHADLKHLFYNVISIFIWGLLLEKQIGSKAIILLIALSSIGMSVVSIIFAPTMTSIGASGIAYALMCAVVTYILVLTIIFNPKKAAGQIVSIFILMLIQIYYNLWGDKYLNIWGHLGGSMVGIGFMLIYIFIHLNNKKHPA